MGLQCSHISFRGTTQEAVARVIRDEWPERDVFISPALMGWVTVFDADCATWLNVETEMVSLASSICRGCDSAGIALAFDRYILMYWLFTNGGELVDKSIPIGPSLSENDQRGLNGRLELMPIALSLSLDCEAIRGVLTKAEVTRSENFLNFTRLLGIENGSWGYRELFRQLDFIDNNQVVGWDRFAHVPRPDPRGLPRRL
jgi:hypothetical protein